MNKKDNKIKNKVALKYGGYATVITVIIIVAAILLNVLTTFLSDRFHLEVDLTTDKTNTMDKSNISYIENVAKDVTITVCASENGFIDGTLAYYAYYMYTAEDSSGYFEKTLNLIKAYPSYNDKIEVVFSDPNEPDFASITAKYPTEQFVYGDIIVESSFIMGGKEISRYKVVRFDDIYELEDTSGMAEYGMGAYTIAGSNLETRLTSAIYYATSDKIINAVTLSGHCDTSVSKNFTDNLANNAYDVSDIPDVVLSENSLSEETDIIILAGVKVDFSVDELQIINDFLENGESRGKGLMFFASTASPALPNLYTFLEEWGISVGEGILYETNENYTYQNAFNISMRAFNEEFLSDLNIMSGNGFITGSNMPISTVYENKGRRYTASLLETSDSVVLAPAGALSDWTPDSSLVKNTYSTAIATRDTSYEENTNGNSSYVFAFSSTDFISSYWAEAPGVLNQNLALHLANMAGDLGNDITFVIKTIDSKDFATQVTVTAKIIVMAIFVIILPLSSLVLCVVIYFRRRNR